MHAWCVQGTPDVNALADTIALNSLKSNLAFLSDTVVFLVSSLEHHIGSDKLVKSAAPRCLRAKPDLNWYPFPYKTRP